MDIEKILSKNEYSELMIFKESDNLLVISISKYLSLTKRQQKCLFSITTKSRDFFRFKVKYLRIGKWVGITVDGDHRIVLKNNIVTHNSSLIGVLIILILLSIFQLIFSA